MTTVLVIRLPSHGGRRSDFVFQLTAGECGGQAKNQLYW